MKTNQWLHLTFNALIDYDIQFALSTHFLKLCCVFGQLICETVTVCSFGLFMNVLKDTPWFKKITYCEITVLFELHNYQLQYHCRFCFCNVYNCIEIS